MILDVVENEDAVEVADGVVENEDAVEVADGAVENEDAVENEVADGAVELEVKDDGVSPRPGSVEENKM
jgi:hypothetical protein